jgi:chromosome segregation protein
MYLKRLEIQGFKSFAQKTTMEFGKGVIAIVGPNGSGKSNVADSLRWVLGEQSAKLIRGKKSDDVIYAGSDKKARMGFAEVFATFDNSDRRIPLDAAEVSIGRRIDRSGESEYLINGQKMRLLDIIDLVLKSNIGTSRYTVIGQGTIDQMILAGPQETKNILDEASGVKSYYMKREKTLRRLEQTAQNLMRAEDLIAEIEPRLKSLRRQAKKMEARAEFEQELKIYQREFFGKTYVTLQQGIDRFLAEIGVLEEKKSKVETSIQEHRKILDTARRVR